MKNDPLTKIKWAGPNTPVIIVKRNDARLYLTKKEALDITRELRKFVMHYSKDFEEPRLSQEEDFDYDDVAAAAWEEFNNENKKEI